MQGFHGSVPVKSMGFGPHPGLGCLSIVAGEFERQPADVWLYRSGGKIETRAVPGQGVDIRKGLRMESSNPLILLEPMSGFEPLTY